MSWKYLVLVKIARPDDLCVLRIYCERFNSKPDAIEFQKCFEKDRNIGTMLLDLKS